MKILDIFKKRKKEPEKKQPIEKTKESIKEEKPVLQREIKKQKKDATVVYGVIKRPHISEKATNLSQTNQYVFKVFSRARKSEIKKAIERIYGVDVLMVNIIAIPAKKRRLGRTTGFKQGYKKAVVKIKESQKIEII